MEDLDALLNDLGLSLVENEYQNQSISEATTSSSSTGMKNMNVTRRSKFGVLNLKLHLID